MARNFVAASSQSLDSAVAVLTVAPITLACWYFTTSNSTEQDLMSIGDTATNDERFSLTLLGDAVGDPVRAQTEAGGTNRSAITSTGYTINVWQHGCAVFASATSRTVYINGGSPGTNTDSATPSGLDATRIGRRANSTGGTFMGGRIAEAAIWNVALTAAEVAVLAGGVCPLLVRPENLVSYYPLIGNFSPELDLCGGFNLTLVNAPTAVDHYPGIIYPQPKQVIAF